MKKVSAVWKLGLLISGLSLIFVFYFYSRVFTSGGGFLEVHFLDIGQGDSILVKSPTGNLILVDGGDGAAIMEKLSKILPFSAREIGLVVATHPDKDHINGLIPVFDKYDVLNFLHAESEKDTDVYETLLEKVRDEGALVHKARRNQNFDIGAGAYIEVLFPDRTAPGLESNTASVVLRLVYGENEFMLSGDSPKAIEEYLVFLDGETIQSDVLKAGHHGSKTSSARSFIAAVSPAFGVLSYGKDNRYGHPHREVLDILAELGVAVLSTAGDGDVVFYSDGERLWHDQ